MIHGLNIVELNLRVRKYSSGCGGMPALHPHPINNNKEITHPHQKTN